MSTGAPGTPRDETCLNCGVRGTGEYCSECGERRLRPDEHSLIRLLTDWFRDVVQFDSKVWRSFRTLVTRPGALTAAYMGGRRAPYLRPVQLFLTANLIYFVVQPYSGFNGFNTTLESHMHRQVYSESMGIEGRIDNAIEERIAAAVALEVSQMEESELSRSVRDSVAIAERVAAVEDSVYRTRFDATGAVFARALVFLIIPMMVVVLWLGFLGTKTPLVRHVVFATHLHAWDLFFIYSFFLFVLRVGARVAYAGAATLTGTTASELMASPLGGEIYFRLMEQGSLVVVFAYSLLALRTAYGSGWLGASLRAALLTWASLVTTVVFRVVLFWATYLSV